MDEKGEAPFESVSQRKHYSIDVIRDVRGQKISQRAALHGISQDESFKGLKPEQVKKIIDDGFLARLEDTGEVVDLLQRERVIAHTLFGTPLPPDLERGLKTSHAIATRKRK